MTTASASPVMYVKAHQPYYGATHHHYYGVESVETNDDGDVVFYWPPSADTENPDGPYAVELRRVVPLSQFNVAGLQQQVDDHRAESDSAVTIVTSDAFPILREVTY